MAEDRLSETREMVVAAQSDIRTLSAGQARIEAKLDKNCEENEEQHREARKLISDGLGRVHARLNLIIGGGFGTLMGILAYLLVYGAPWVPVTQYKEDITEIRQMLREMHDDHNHVMP